MFNRVEKLIVFTLLALFLDGSASLAADITQARHSASSDHYWSAFFGGEWNFLSDEGAPLNGVDWQEIRYGIGYIDRTRFNFFFHHRMPARTERMDQVLGFEANAKVFGPVWFRGAVHGSPDHDFTYQVRTDSELMVYYKHYMVGAGYWYINYNTTDIHLVTPFFQISYLKFLFDARYLRFLDTTEDEYFHALSVRWSYNFDSPWWYPFVGVVVGQRIFGILTVQETPDQDGHIIYVGNKIDLTPKVMLALYVSYARESSIFQYVGLATDIHLRF